jgi:hypothetical protein
VLTIFNFIEACFWAGVAVGVLIFSERLPDKRRRIAYVATAAFFLFGISDVVEIHTGAWWRPPWLLLLKGCCIIVLLACLASYLKVKNR